MSTEQRKVNKAIKNAKKVLEKALYWQFKQKMWTLDSSGQSVNQ